MKCPTCQHEVSGRFCPNCGTDVQALTGAGSPSDPNATSILNRQDLAAYRDRQSGSTPPVAREMEPGGYETYPRPAAPYPTQPEQYPGGQGPAWQSQGGLPPAGVGEPAYGRPGEYPPGAGYAAEPEPPAAPAQRGRRRLILGILVLVGLFALGAIAVLALQRFANADSGKVKFGTAYTDSGSKFSVQGQKSTFNVSDHVAWVGYLSESVDATTLRRTITRINANGSRTVLVNRAVQLSSSTSNKVDQVAADSSVAALEELGVNPPGTYEIVYLSRGKTESRGRFTLTGSSPVGQVFFARSATDSMIAGVSQNGSFRRSDTMNYAAHFAGPQGPGRLTVRIYRIQSDGSEALVSRGLYDDLKDAGLWVRVNQVSIRDLMGYGANKSGTYILGYYKKKTLLAQGKFTLHL